MKDDKADIGSSSLACTSKREWRGPLVGTRTYMRKIYALCVFLSYRIKDDVHCVYLWISCAAVGITNTPFFFTVMK